MASSAELTAVAKHPCPACGAQAEWHPSQARLVCPYCGTEAPYEIDPASGQVQEIDLVRTLRELPEELRGWQTATKSVRCQSCRAVSVFDAERVGQRCDFCGSSALLAYEELKPPIRPQSLLPFRVAEADAREHLRRWLGSRWFAPGNLRRRSLTDTVRGLYVPYWTFDAQTECTWRAESGTYYYETRTVRDAQGRRRQQRVRKVRWQPAAGHVSHFFDDQPVPGTRGIDPGLLKAVEPFPTAELVPYDTAYLSGFVVEHYQVVLVDAAQAARATMDGQLRDLCGRQVPGDTYRNLEIAPVYSAETFKHILVPVWLLAYDYGRRKFQVVVNGVTGRVAGRYPKSPWKILLLVLAVLLVVFLVLSAGS